MTQPTENALLDSHEPTFEFQFFGNIIMGGNDAMLIRGQHADAVLNRLFANGGHALRVVTWDGVTVQDGVRTLYNRVRTAYRNGVQADGRASGDEPISHKPGLEVVGDRVEESGKVSGTSVVVAHATEAVVDVTTRSNRGATGVEISDSRLRSLEALGDDAATPVKLTNSTVSSNTTSGDKGT